MCLIIFSPQAKLPPRAWFAEAAVSNPDGIGVMSADGTAKFLGKRKTRRAWRYVSQLSADGMPFGVHFRYATHGRVNRANCHPFEVPGSGAYMMHNGVLWTSLHATEEVSDTRIFAQDVMPRFMSLAERGAEDYLQLLNAEAIGNRLLVMHPSGRWDVVNRHLWIERDGLLYSNTYSIDALDDGSRWQRYCSTAATTKSKRRQASGAGYLVPAVTRGWPSGPSLAADAGEDYSEFAEDIIENLWQSDYEDALDSGFTEADAEAWANDQEARRSMATRNGADVRGEVNGFDWHDRSTWDKYPIPGTEYRERVLNRHGDGESPDDYGTPDARDMFV